MKKRTNFKKAVKKSVEKQNREASAYGYLQLPKGVRVFKEKEGHMYFDILPYEVTIDNHPDYDVEDKIAEKNTLWYRLPFKVHKGIGADNETVVCPTSFGKPCPICAHKKKRQLEGAEKDELSAYQASKRNLYVVIPINDKKQDEEPHIYDVSDYLFQQLLNNELGEKEQFNSFPDLDDGYTLDVRYEEKTFAKNKYYQANRIDFENREPYDESILDSIPNLDKCLIIKSYKEIENLFFEMESETEQEAETVEDEKEAETIEDKEPAPAPTRRRKTIKKTEQETETETEQEQEPAPKSEPKNKPKQESKNECPYNHEFGKDLDKFEDCAECEMWNECLEKSEE